MLRNTRLPRGGTRTDVAAAGHERYVCHLCDEKGRGKYYQTAFKVYPTVLSLGADYKENSVSTEEEEIKSVAPFPQTHTARTRKHTYIHTHILLPSLPPILHYASTPAYSVLVNNTPQAGGRDSVGDHKNN